jgi:O-antigen/teichoic acid export membrane protein
MAIGLWLTPFYIRTLGTKDYGIWLVGLQVLTFLLLCDFGILAVLPRDVANASGREQAEAGSGYLQEMIGQTMKIVFAQTGILALAALGLFLFRPASAPELRGPVGLVLFVFVLSYPARLFPAVLQGLQDLKFLGQLRLWLWALSTATCVILLLFGARFYALACGWCLQEVANNIIAVVRLRRLRPDLVDSNVWQKAGPIRWRWFTRGLWVSVGQIAYSMVAGADLLIIGRFLGPATVVVYASTSKLITILQNQPSILACAALPGLSHLKMSESRERILQVTTSLTQGMLLLVGFVFCIVLSINQQFVTVWLGGNFFGGLRLTILLLLNFLVQQIDYTLAVALFAFGYEKLAAVRLLVAGVVCVTLASIFVRSWGLEGAALGFLLGTLLVAIPVDAFILSREFNVSILHLTRPYASYLWRFALAGVAGWAIVARIGPSNLWYIAMAAVLVGSIYLLSVFPYVWRTPLRTYILAVTATLRSALRIWMLKPSKALIDR